MPKNDEPWRGMVLSRIKPIGGVEADEHGGCDQRVFQQQIIEPMALEWHVATFHHALPLAAASGLAIVVLASHSPASDMVLRVFPTKPRFSKKPRALSLASTSSSLLPRAAASFSSASHSMVPAPCPAAAGCT